MALCPFKIYLGQMCPDKIFENPDIKKSYNEINEPLLRMIALIDEDLTETLYLCIMIINFIFIKIPHSMRPLKQKKKNGLRAQKVREWTPILISSSTLPGQIQGHS